MTIHFSFDHIDFIIALICIFVCEYHTNKIAVPDMIYEGGFFKGFYILQAIFLGMMYLIARYCMPTTLDKIHFILDWGLIDLLLILEMKMRKPLLKLFYNNNKIKWIPCILLLIIIIPMTVFQIFIV